jgi:exonuclease III
VCLQELKAPDEKFPAPALRAAGYGAVWHGQKSWNGVAIAVITVLAAVAVAGGASAQTAAFTLDLCAAA